MLRLNTTISSRVASAQDSRGVLSNDTAGYPNGRRPGDDVVDITIQVAMGALCEIGTCFVCFDLISDGEVQIRIPMYV